VLQAGGFQVASELRSLAVSEGQLKVAVMLVQLVERLELPAEQAGQQGLSLLV
jgi:hypothetical protein